MSRTTMDDERTREAVTARLDTRCVEWAFIAGFPPPRRCGECDGCVAGYWLRDRAPTAVRP